MTGRQRVTGFAGVIALFLVVLAATRSTVLGDTAVYAGDIAAYLHQGPFGSNNRLWEFGHLLWRPLGWVFTSLASPWLAGATDWTPTMQATAVLIAINLLSAIIAVALWYLLILDFDGSPNLALWVSLGFAFSHGFLLYAQSGSAYVPGLACATASLYALRRGKVWWGAALYALAALIWFPYVLLGAALGLVSVLPREWSESIRDGLRKADLKKGLRFIAYSSICIVSGYGMALAAKHIGSTAEAKAWFAESQHGLMQSIRAIRIATGLPRSFLFLGRDGVLYRRFLFHDPFASVSILDLVQASLWKIAAFGVFALALLYELGRKRGWFALVMAAAVAPVLFFAVVLFEPGSPERYLPALPFLLVGVAVAIQDIATAKRFSQWLLVAFLVCVAANNGYAFWAPRVAREDAASLQRVAEVRQQLKPDSMVVVLSNQDLLMEVANRSPFGNINRPWSIPLYDALEVASARILTWRKEFSERALKAWGKGGDVWVSKRLWASKPLPEWYWVEGETPTIHWVEVPQFFAELQTDIDVGGNDGFLRLTRNEANQKLLLAATQSDGMGHSK